MTDDKPSDRLPKRESDSHCQARKRKGGYCKKSAGWGTWHVGQGRCKLHGGAKPIKTGLYSKYVKGQFKKQLQDWEKVKGDDLKDLTEELRVLKVIVSNILELASAADETESPAYMKWLGDSIERVARVVEIIDKITRGNRFVVTVENVEALRQQFARLFEKWVPKEKQEQALSDLRALD